MLLCLILNTDSGKADLLEHVASSLAHYAAAAIGIWVDRGEGAGFVFLTINTEPNTNDTQPLPATSAIWKYKAIYRLHDEQVGHWIDVLSITVGV